MGTTIRIKAWKSETTPKDVWANFRKRWLEEYPDGIAESGDEVYCDSGIIFCSYTSADVRTHMNSFKEFKGSDIEFDLWFEERDPDEQGVL